MSDSFDIEALSSTFSSTCLEGELGQSTVNPVPTSIDSDLGSSSRNDIDWNRLHGFRLPQHTKHTRRGWACKLSGCYDLQGVFQQCRVARGR